MLLLWTARIVCTQSMETWGIWYIDESFLVWIIPSRYQSHKPICWARTISFVTYVYHITWFLIHVWVCMLTTQFSMHAFHSDLSIHVCLSCMPLGIHHTTRWGVLTLLDLHVQILEFGPRWASWWSELHSGSIMDQQLTVRSPILPGPLLVSRAFFCYSWAPFVLFIIVYLLLFSHLRLSVM